MKICLSFIFAVAVSFSAHAAPARIDVSNRMGVQEIVVSVKNLDQASQIYEDIAKYAVKHQGPADTSLSAAWGLPKNTPITERVLGLGDLDKGFLRLVKIEGLEQVQIRSSARPFDTGGIFNFNSVVKDIDAIFEALRDRGFQGFADPNRYTLFGKNYAGALLRGHDGVVINLLQRVNQPYDDLPPFETMSHIMNATQMVANYQESYDFFTTKLGWAVRWEASPTWPLDGANNMGLPNNLLTSGAVTERAASFLIAKGADGGSVEIFNFEGVTGKDYSDRAGPPNLGLLTYRIHVRGLKNYLSQIAARGVELHRPLAKVTLAPYGEVDLAVVRAPSGAWLEFFEQRPLPDSPR